jgi:hypothetical protein
VLRLSTSTRLSFSDIRRDCSSRSSQRVALAGEGLISDPGGGTDGTVLAFRGLHVCLIVETAQNLAP